MSAQLEIVFTDRGGPPQPVTRPPNEAPEQRAPGPADRVTGPRKRTDEPITPLEGGVKAAEVIGRALGVGGLVATVKELASSFSALFKAVTQSTAAHAENAATVKSSTKATRPDFVGPAKGAGSFGQEPIDVDFELKGPKPGLTPVGPRPDRVAGTGSGGELIRAPQALSTRHATTRVETVGITGPRPTPAITGPAAGAGTAASGMSALAAAAGPAAVAVAVLTAAVVGGAVVVRKVFDSLRGEADRLSGFSGPLSAAQAQSEIRAEFADLRRAQRIGPGLARFENTASRAETALKDAVTELQDELLKRIDKLLPLIDLGSDLVEVGSKNMAVIVRFIESLSPVAGTVSALADRTDQLVKLARRFLRLEEEKADKEPDKDPFMEAFLASVKPARPVPGFPARGGGLGP